MEKSQENKKRRRRSLRGTRLWPLMEAGLTVLLMGGAAALLFLFVLPLLQGRLSGPADLSCLGIATPTPLPTPTPTPRPSPTLQPGMEKALYGVDLGQVQQEIVIGEYQYAADFSVTGDTVLFAAGNYTQDGGAAFIRAIAYDVSTKKATYYPLELSYTSIRFPRMNDSWIVYLDATSSGGGQLRVYNRRTGENRILKTVHMGLPALALWEDTVFWVERTGTSRDKLFGCDLNTGESVTLDILTNQEAAVSKPYVGGEYLLYVSAPGTITRRNLRTGAVDTLSPGTTVHDPKTDGSIVAFLTGFHGEDGQLAYMDEGGELHTVANGVEDFDLFDGGLVYGTFDKTYAYFFDDRATFCLTRRDESALFLAGGGDIALWLDVTWRDKDIIEYMHLTEFEEE